MVDLNNYVIRLNRDGLIMQSDISKRTLQETVRTVPLAEREAVIHINNIFSQAEKLADEKGIKDESDPVNPKVVVKLLLHVHGGLNFFNETDTRVNRVAKLIESANDDWAYPVFFSWPSSFPGTYADHLTYIREGRKTTLPLGLLSSPFVLIADLVQSIGKYPLDVYYQLVNAKDIISTPKDDNSNWLPTSWVSYAWKRAKSEYCQRQSNPGQDCKPEPSITTREGLQLNWSNYSAEKAFPGLAVKAVTSPFRYTFGTLGQSSIAISAWKNMKRRTANIFFPPSLFDDRDSPNAVFDRHIQFKDAQGQLNNGLPGGEFFKLLFKRIDANKAKYSYQVTLVGHSMGTIVLNNALKKYKNDWSRTGVLRNIVYMAAACSIDDVVESVFPMLKKINTTDPKAGKQVNFYNLMLNRIAEISETNVYGIAPTGSLLIYIDQHLEVPNHPFERTFGSEINVLSSLTALDDELREKGIGDHIQFKSFDSYPGYIPNKHGDFSNTPFWQKSFWEVSTKTQPPEDSHATSFNAYPNHWLDF